MAAPRRPRWTRRIGAVAAVLLAVAVFVLAAVLGELDLARHPTLGPLIAEYGLLVAVGLMGLILVLWLLRWGGMGAADRAEAKAADAEARLRAAWPSDRRVLLDQRRAAYQQLLDTSLRHEVGKRLRDDDGADSVRVHLALRVLQPAVRRRTGEAVGLERRTDSLLDEYDDAGGRLLILGEPGAGKSTFLLELALHLLERARDDDALRVPVIVNLADWGDERRPLAEWLEGRLPAVLGAGAEFARFLVRDHKLHLLLDGLDEVEEGHRAACIEAVNAYAQERPEQLVVCCRTEEYRAVQDELDLTDTVEVLPLRLGEVLADLEAVPEAAGVRLALGADAGLREITTTPLALSVVLLTYLGQETPSFATLPAGQRMRALWDDYLVRMLARRGAPSDRPFAPADVLRWLAWLARKMKAADQTDFILDYLQPDWLEDRRPYDRRVPIVFGLVVGLVVGLVGGLVGGLFVGLVVGLGGGLGNNREIIELTETMRWDTRVALDGFRREWKQRLVAGLVGGLVGGLVFGLVGGLFGGLFGGLGVGLVDNGFVISTLQTADRPGYRVRRTLVNGLFVGLVFGLVGGLFSVLFVGLVGGLGGVLFVGLVGGLGVGLVGGLLDQGGGGLRHYIMRSVLVREGALPWRAVDFLLYASDLLLLQREGDIVRFRHLLLRDHLADAAHMTPDHIEALAARVEQEAATVPHRA